MTHLEQEKKTVRQIVEIYCYREKHSSSKGLCEECSALLDYACQRLNSCSFGEQKPTCKKCPVHCYKPEMREKIRQVMRYAGPRMIWYHPLTAIRHLLREISSSTRL